MLRHEKSAPIWLFSFVDLAFLLLIAFTQIGSEIDPDALDVAQLEIPRIESDGEPLAGSSVAGVWQLRVLPLAAGEPADESRAPFELVEPGVASDVSRPIGVGELASQLDLLRDRRAEKPLLAPHRDSRSEDLLVAVGLLEDTWQSDRSVAVVPRPAVATGPDVQVDSETRRAR